MTPQTSDNEGAIYREPRCFPKQSKQLCEQEVTKKKKKTNENYDHNARIYCWTPRSDRSHRDKRAASSNYGSKMGPKRPPFPHPFAYVGSGCRKMGTLSYHSICFLVRNPAHVIHVRSNCRAEFYEHQFFESSFFYSIFCLIKFLLSHPGRKKSSPIVVCEGGAICAPTQGAINYSYN